MALHGHTRRRKTTSTGRTFGRVTSANARNKRTGNLLTAIAQKPGKGKAKGLHKPFKGRTTSSTTKTAPKGKGKGLRKVMSRLSGVNTPGRSGNIRVTTRKKRR